MVNSEGCTEAVRFLGAGAGGLVVLVEERGTQGCLLADGPVDTVFRMIQIVEI